MSVLIFITASVIALINERLSMRRPYVLINIRNGYCRGYSFCNPQRSTTPCDERHRNTRTATRNDLLRLLTSGIGVQELRDLSETSVRGV